MLDAVKGNIKVCGSLVILFQHLFDVGEDAGQAAGEQS